MPSPTGGVKDIDCQTTCFHSFVLSTFAVLVLAAAAARPTRLDVIVRARSIVAQDKSVRMRALAYATDYWV